MTKKEDTLGGKALLSLNKIICYIFLVLLSVLCLFSFYILLINASRAHADIIKGFSFLPGKAFLTNMKGLLSDDNIPMVRALGNSLFISSLTALFTTYFSAMTAFGLHIYNFKLKKFAFSFIMHPISGLHNMTGDPAGRDITWDLRATNIHLE